MYQEIYDNKVFYRKIIDIKGEDSIESYLLHNLIKSMQKILVNSKISGLEKICPQFLCFRPCYVDKKWIIDDHILIPREMAEYYLELAAITLCSNYLYKNHI